jgi:integration host factor subunit alpha
MASNNFRKIDIIKNLSLKTGYSVLLTKKILNDLIEVIIFNIKNNKLNIKNFGTFKILNKKQRLGRNPITKEKFIISSRKTLVFTASKKIYKELNN